MDELVESDLGLSEVFGNTLDEGATHVDTDFLDARSIGVVRVDMIGELGDRAGILAVGDEDNLAAVDVVAKHASGMTNREI